MKEINKRTVNFGRMKVALIKAKYEKGTMEGFQEADLCCNRLVPAI